MKKIITCMAVASLFLVGCKGKKSDDGQKTIDPIAETINEYKIPALPEHISTEDMGDDIQVYTIKMGNDPDKSHLTASFPITKYNFVNENEKNFTEKLIEEFKSLLKSNRGEIVSLLDFNQHFEVKFHSDDFLVFLHTQNISLGNNYENRNVASIYNLKKQEKLRPQDFFKSPTDFDAFVADIRPLLTDMIVKKVQKDPNYANDQEREQVLSSINETLLEGTEPSEANYDALFFDEKGQWWVIFDKYQVASGSMGEFMVNLPKEMVAKYIADDLLKPFTEKLVTETPAIVPEAPSEVDCTKVPCVCLTFDDGPSVYTPALLDALKEANVKATFFVLGKSAAIQKKTLKRMAEEGHNIGNHSYDHKDFRKIAPEEAENQIRLTDEVIQGITGSKPTYFRFPYGAHTEANLKQVGRPVILWNVDPMDWKYRDAQRVAQEMSKASPKAIILAHDIHKSTVEAIPQVIKNLKASGYHIVTLDALFKGKQLQNGGKYSSGK